MALDEPHRFVKINLDRNYLQLQNPYIYSNNYNAVIAPCWLHDVKRSVDSEIPKLERQMTKNSP